MKYLHLKLHILVLRGKRCFTSQEHPTPAASRPRKELHVLLDYGLRGSQRRFGRFGGEKKSLAQSVMELIFICCQARSLIMLVLISTDL